MLQAIISLPAGGELSSALEESVGHVTRVELSSVLKQLGREGRTAHCLALFEWMEGQRGRLRPNGHVYCLMLGIVSR